MHVPHESLGGLASSAAWNIISVAAEDRDLLLAKATVELLEGVSPGAPGSPRV